MAHSRVAGGLQDSPASSGIFFQGDMQSQNVLNSPFTSSFGNSVNSIPGGAQSNLDQAPGDINQLVLNSVATSGPSMGASSLVTDANSGFSGGPQLQRTPSINTDSYMRVPASPISFSSNNISATGSSLLEGSPTMQQNSRYESSSRQSNQNQLLLQHGASTTTSLSMVQPGQSSLHLGARIGSTVIQDPSNSYQMQKRPRLDIKQEEIPQHQLLQQLLQRHDMQLPSHNPQYQAYLQQLQRLRDQQIFQAMPQMQQTQLQHQHKFKNQLQQPGIQQMPSMRNQYESTSICFRRLMQYLYHQRQRDLENPIAYWRKFVAEYYAPRAKKRWCLSLYENVAQHALGAFPRAAMDAWHCEICGARSGRGFEATYEVLPRLNEMKFSSGVLDEFLFLDLPHERRLASGMMILEFAKAVQVSVYEQLRVVHEGQLRIVFSQDLKIFSWEFCARRHEELVPRRLIAPQVNQLLQVVQKCQSAIADAGPEGVSSQDLQSNSNMVVSVGHQLAKSLDLQLLNDLGFSKRYVRCLQIAEVVNHMKDLIDFCMEAKVGPIDGLKNYPPSSKIQMKKFQELEQMATMQGLPTDRNTLTKFMELQSGINHPGNNNNVASWDTTSGSAAAAAAITNYQNMLVRQSPFNTNAIALQQEVSLNNSKPGPGNIFPGSVQNLPSGSSDPSLASPQPSQFQHCAQIANSLPQHNQSTYQLPPTNSQALQNQMIQRFWQDMSNNSMATRQQKPLSGQNGTGNSVSNVTRMGNYGSVTTAATSYPGGSIGGHVLSKNNSFKAASNNDPSAAGCGNSGFNHSTQDLPDDLQVPDMIPDIADEFLDVGFFDGDIRC